MRSPALFLFFALTGSPFASSTATAQQAARDGASLVAALRVVPADEPIRITTIGHSTYEGRITSLSDSVVSVLDAGRTQTAELVRVRAVWVRDDASRTGAISAAIAGGILGGLAIGILANGLCEYQCNGAFGQGFALGTAVSAPAGALAGYVVGSFVDRWTPYWTRERGVVGRVAVNSTRASEPPAHWTPAFHGGLSHEFDKGPWIVGASLEKQRSPGRTIGVEVGMVTPRREKGSFVSILPNEDSSADTTSHRSSTARKSYYLGLVTRRSLGSGVAVVAMAGAAHNTEVQDFRSTDRDGMPLSGRYTSTGLTPVFSIGLAKRFRVLNGEVRWLAPVDLGGAGWSTITATLSVAVPRLSM